MRNQNPPEIGRFVEDVAIWCTDNPCGVRIPEINGPLAAAQAKDDLLVEVRVSLKPRPHALGLCAPCRAASSLTTYDLNDLVPVWRELPNLTIQSFFSEGRFSNTEPSDVEPWLERLGNIRPCRLQIYTLDRVPPVPLMRKAGIETLQGLAEKVRQRLACAVEVFE